MKDLTTIVCLLIVVTAIFGCSTLESSENKKSKSKEDRFEFNREECMTNKEIAILAEKELNRPQYDGKYLYLIDSALNSCLLPKYNIRFYSDKEPAITSGFERYSQIRSIFINDNFLNDLNSSSSDTNNHVILLLLFHEIGHQIFGHTVNNCLRLGRQNVYMDLQQAEIDADIFAGYQMFMIGATLEESLEGISVFHDRHGIGHYPDEETRIIAVKKGYYNALKCIEQIKQE